jgi:hypothetical protein
MTGFEVEAALHSGCEDQTVSKSCSAVSGRQR